MRAERAVAARLAEALGEEWTLFCGYRNRLGEIDELLVGPSGIFADAPLTLDASQRASVEQLIVQDHALHEGRGRRRTTASKRAG